MKLSEKRFDELYIGLALLSADCKQIGRLDGIKSGEIQMIRIVWANGKISINEWIDPEYGNSYWEYVTVLEPAKYET